MKLGFVLGLPATALHTTATALRFFAGVGERLADAIKTAEASTGDTTPVNRGPARVPVTPAAPAATPAVVREVPGSPVAPLSITALAAQPANDIIAALDGLSTVELADLYDHESHHRRRRAVLDAVQAAAAPPVDVRGEDPLPSDDARIPDEVVYSTQTPRR